MKKMRIFLFFSLFLCSILASKDPLQYLINKFEKKMDTNIYYFKNYERQQNERHFCLATDGPYCSFLNGKFLGSISQKPHFSHIFSFFSIFSCFSIFSEIFHFFPFFLKFLHFFHFFCIFSFFSLFFKDEATDNRETSIIKQNVLKNAIIALEKLNFEKLNTEKNSIFYYYDQMRENLDEIYGKQGQFSSEKSDFSFEKPANIEVFFDFENIPLENKGYLLEFSLKVEINEKNEKNEKNADFLTSIFTGFFVPSKQLFFSEEKRGFYWFFS